MTILLWSHVHVLPLGKLTNEAINKYTGQEFSVVLKYIRSPMGIQVFADEVQPKGNNVCEPNNGGCSHICFPLPAYNSAQSSLSGCMCPDFYIMLSDNKTCISMDTERANPDLTNDTGVTSREIIVYPIIGVVVVILITVVLILIFWYRRRNTPPRSERTYEDPDNRISTVSAIYDTIDEQKELTSKMNNSHSGSVNPYLELSSSRTDPKNTYSDLIRINGDMNMPKCGTE